MTINRAIAHFADACRILDERHAKAIGELHPLLRARVERVLDRCGGRFKAWQGFRSPIEQETAFLEGNSNAKFGESPHNWRPALAVDVVLDPRVVAVRENVNAPGWPDEWDDVTDVAVDAWNLLELAAAAEELDRVTIRGGKKDLPHLQLPAWRSYIPS